ncbi:MAG: hypothetical protein HY692_06215 [Cyanobacteria bacterium NC_groundwater_1444_Ag_S-0.65um_54_12]|nr:hypothetical protein [Cyanobacteria bacterium NC_groundwater_1444_Ag_S-0.65um_54_12]
MTYLVETGPGFISPNTSGYQPPGTNKAFPNPFGLPIEERPPFYDDNLQVSPPVLAPAANGNAPATPVVKAAEPKYQAKSFLSNLWDQFLGPFFQSIWDFVATIFGKR